MIPSDPRRGIGRWATVAILVSIVTIDAVLLSLRGDTVVLTTWWSSVGLGVIVVCLSPLRRWPVLLVVLFLLTTAVATVFGLDTTTSLILASSHTAQVVVAATVLTRLGRRRPAILALSDLGSLGLAAIAGGVIASAVETTTRPDEVRASVEVALQVGSQHALSILLFGAFLLSPAPTSTGGTNRRIAGVRASVVLHSVALVAALAAVFLPLTAAPLTFALFPILVCGAIAFEIRTASAQLLFLAGAVTLTTANGRGPFARSSVDPDLIGSVTLGYVACAALVTLPLAVIVTQRRLLLDRVASDEQLFRRTFTESPLGMVLMRRDGDHLEITEVNAAAVPTLGAPADELVGRRFADLVDTLDHHEQVFDALLAQEVDSWHGPASVLGRPGSRIDLAIAAITSSDSAPVFSAQLLDQTQEQDSRRRLDVAHKLTDATLDTAACIILVADAVGRIVRVNGATELVTGYDASTLVGSFLWESPLAALTRAETEAMFVWPNRSGFPMVREQLTSTADGAPIRLVWNNNVVHSETGAPSYVVLTGVDVTAERSSTGLIAHLLQASIATALIGIDVAGRITVVNAGAAHMLGSSAEELIGAPFVSLLDPEQVVARTGALGEHEAFLCLIGMIGSGEESAARDWTWRTRDGHELIVSMTLSVTGDDVQDRVGFLCVGRDVTEQREGQETLITALQKERTAVERLRSLDRAKDEFVSTVSHELRTPVTSILGYTELLLEGDVVPAAPQQVPMLETIARSSHRLVAICNDLLMLSDFESRETLANRETHDLREALGVAEDFARSLTSQRPLAISFTSPDAPVMIDGDRSQLERVLLNLVSNAIKFTRDHGSVDISLSRDAARGAVIRVDDTGIGIHHDDHDLVFQRFYRTDDAQKLAIPGTGLGLSIVAGIVDAHGGTIALASEPGRGTSFTVQLPVVA